MAWHGCGGPPVAQIQGQHGNQNWICRECLNKLETRIDGEGPPIPYITLPEVRISQKEYESLINRAVALTKTFELLAEREER